MIECKDSVTNQQFLIQNVFHETMKLLEMSNRYKIYKCVTYRGLLQVSEVSSSQHLIENLFNNESLLNLVKDIISKRVGYPALPLPWVTSLVTIKSLNTHSQTLFKHIGMYLLKCSLS